MRKSAGQERAGSTETTCGKGTVTAGARTAVRDLQVRDSSAQSQDFQQIPPGPGGTHSRLGEEHTGCLIRWHSDDTKAVSQAQERRPPAFQKETEPAECHLSLGMSSRGVAPSYMTGHCAPCPLSSCKDVAASLRVPAWAAEAAGRRCPPGRTLRRFPVAPGPQL